MDKKESLLGLDFQTIADLSDRPSEVFLSDDYLQRVFFQMASTQPALLTLLGTESYNRFSEHWFVNAGALTAYDMIVSSDPHYWLCREISRDLVDMANRNILSYHSESGEISYEMPDLGWFYEKVAEDSPSFTDWLECLAFTFQNSQQMTEFVSGVLLISMPFYMVKEGEALAENLGAI
jgi:hypothetical protein